jgi:hypothetical protein
MIMSRASVPKYGDKTMKRAYRLASLKEDQRNEFPIRMLDLPLS